ncbi:hypothetical protein NSU_3171 [Novosphingobium pentaromativorans US6-1]|uniref:Uncharacterized protein n=1 Tax=Novosphingobium pentaromativorans US6-1 TaxID=1088721 RepID=G6EFQ0_9SPHN|nr:hypothetical protein NSU_3171 [Novosphingobium pentaromativorans US6-1]
MADHLFEPASDLDQQGIASRVTVSVVDFLEVIEIDEQHACSPSCRKAHHRALEGGVEQGAVRQSRKQIEVRHVGDAGFGTLGFAYIGDEPAPAAPFSAQLVNEPPAYRPPALFPARHQGQDQVAKAFAALQLVLQFLQVDALVKQRRQRHAAKLRRLDAAGVAKSRGRVGNMASGIDLVEPVAAFVIVLVEEQTDGFVRLCQALGADTPRGEKIVEVVDRPMEKRGQQQHDDGNWCGTSKTLPGDCARHEGPAAGKNGRKRQMRQGQDAYPIDHHHRQAQRSQFVGVTLRCNDDRPAQYRRPTERAQANARLPVTQGKRLTQIWLCLALTNRQFYADDQGASGKGRASEGRAGGRADKQQKRGKPDKFEQGKRKRTQVVAAAAREPVFLVRLDVMTGQRQQGDGRLPDQCVSGLRFSHFVLSPKPRASKQAVARRRCGLANSCKKYLGQRH